MYKAGIYCRLSIEERDKESECSNSIRSQILIAEDYIAGQENVEKVKVYADDGTSGSNFDRTEFRRMLADIELGVINMVILKDVSRLGREHIDTNYYLGKYFPEKKIRVVSILDHYDSDISTYDELPGYQSSAVFPPPRPPDIHYFVIPQSFPVYAIP